MLLIGNGRVITRDPENPYLQNGAVVTEGAKIAAVGDCDALKKAYPDAQFVDAAGGIIMPGLINAHTHIYSGLARGLAVSGYNPTNFLEILEGMWWNIDRHLTLDGTQASAYATILDCIRNGVTAIFDHHASFCGFALCHPRRGKGDGDARMPVLRSVRTRRRGEDGTGYPRERGLCRMGPGSRRSHDQSHVRRPCAVYDFRPDV